MIVTSKEVDCAPLWNIRDVYKISELLESLIDSLEKVYEENIAPAEQ